MSDRVEKYTEHSWRKALLNSQTTLQTAITNLENSGLQIILVVDTNGSLVGTITDGDIRRGLLRGLDLNSPIDSIIHQDPLVVPAQMSRETVLQLMQANEIHALPIVDETRQVIGLHSLNELLTPYQRPNLMIIMAGGKGTRLHPYTTNCPKPLLPVGGKPILEHIIERAKEEGFQHFILAVHYLGHMIEDYFGDGHAWQIQIDYLREKHPLGTAGAISLLHFSPKTPLVVSNGDVLTDIRYGEMVDFHNQHGAAATMAVRLHEWQNPFGVVNIQGVDIVSFEEKPVVRSHVNAGIYVLSPTALNALEKDQYCDMPTLFSRLKERGERTIVYPMHEPWLDVGRVEELNKAQQEWNNHLTSKF
ncbi:nucleotidyltransferase family protein [Spirulina subsalsa FACHB-351]|uniref:Nucleotidyltransferase family protein n=1 Tax=Spirulina subsalsa FACHB-351 TaxID=234711 RepID=A0ABT3L8R4_9CYAN|nr:nucleotidyltransferase family protein [Spirulina subsalsa]MCW6037896.1 nucleotidyltransferase family protein [Spirulina subsalsa FACHB-351]